MIVRGYLDLSVPYDLLHESDDTGIVANGKSSFLISGGYYVRDTTVVTGVFVHGHYTDYWGTLNKKLKTIMINALFKYRANSNLHIALSSFILIMQSAKLDFLSCIY